VVFGSAEGRDLVFGLHGDSLLNKLSYKMMEDFLKRLTASLPMHKGKLKILDGRWDRRHYKMACCSCCGPRYLSRVHVYKSVVGFRRSCQNKFKQYLFMRYVVHDIEKAPQKDLVATQHIVVASNAIHATTHMVKSLESTG
jgi:hypothetical protein